MYIYLNITHFKISQSDKTSHHSITAQQKLVHRIKGFFNEILFNPMHKGSDWQSLYILWQFIIYFYMHIVSIFLRHRQTIQRQLKVLYISCIVYTAIPIPGIMLDIAMNMLQNA